MTIGPDIVYSMAPSAGLGCGKQRMIRHNLPKRGPMETLLLPFSPRFVVLTICAVATALLLGLGIADHRVDLVLIPLLIFGGLTALGIRDLTQKSHAVLRNYPISAHLRFLLEEIRPEMRQYFFESEKDGMPFSRDTRAVIYQRAKMVLDKRPFGTQEDVYREGYEWMHHSVAPKPHADEKFRVTIGGPDCTRPYSASVFNISAMSVGANRSTFLSNRWRKRPRSISSGD